MDFEAPVDAWVVWVGVVLVGVALTGVTLTLPSQPPPDATGAANTIDRVAGSTHVASASYEHDAEAVRIDTKRLSMRNDGGVAHASVAFGSLTPVHAVENETVQEVFERLLDGEHPSSVLDDDEYDSLTESALRETATETRARLASDDSGPDWRPADGRLRVRTVELDGTEVVLVAV